jgi:hypothetical protein
MQPHVSNNGATCPECGAPRRDGLGCWEQLGLLIASEHEDPELRAEHFLLVASYNLQHPAQFTDVALAGLREVFLAHLHDGLAVAEIRRRIGRAMAGSTRVLRDEAERRPVRRAWSMTIGDVFLPTNANGAAGRVRAWASTIAVEM